MESTVDLLNPGLLGLARPSPVARVTSSISATPCRVLTLAVRKGAPGAVLQAGDRLQLVTRGEGKPVVALKRDGQNRSREQGAGSREPYLELCLAPPGDVTGDDGEPVINLRHWAAVGLHAGRDVVIVPGASRAAGRHHLLHPRGEKVANGTREGDHAAGKRL